MQDTMMIWDSICHSQWFKQTSIVCCSSPSFHAHPKPWLCYILFLNKDGLFEKKISHSDIQNFFPVGHCMLHARKARHQCLHFSQEYDSEPGDIWVGWDYFKK